ncbi:MAG: sulfite exporter TauE/SafE family protein [Flavobacteriales bacterium]|nr:sulfite exporter TauE/SafE family protein [Flavobacteriales bacterium]
MTFEAIVLFLALALLAEILGTIGGFGSSVFFVPIAAQFMPFLEVLGLTAIFHVASNLSKILLFRKGIDRRIILLLGIPAVLFVIIGAWSTSFLDAEKLEFALGIVLVGLSLFFLMRPSNRIKASNANAVIGGVLSGGIAGLVGTGGAIRGMTLAAFGMSKNVFIATSAFIDLGVDLSRTIVYTGLGYMTLKVLYLTPFLIGVGLLGTFIGKVILEKITQEKFQRIVLFLILGVGVTMLL